MPQFIYYVYFNNTVLDYLMFLLFFVIGCITIKIVGYFLIKYLNKWAKKTETTTDDLLVQGISKYLMPILYFCVFYLDTKTLFLNSSISKIINISILAFVMIMGAIFISSITAFFLNKYWKYKVKGEDNKLALNVLTGVAKIIIWGLALILFLDNIGVKISSLVAGLGIGGIAIAFAAQSALTDIFCFFSIIFDRPFEIGDFIVIEEQMGTVEHIGLKTTRLRALNGEQLIFSNTFLTSSHLSNYKTMEKRRVLFTIGVTYNTPHEKLKEIPGLIKSIVDSTQDAVFGRTHFFSYGAYSLNFEIAYFVLSSDYDKYMDINQEINLRIKEEFEKKELEFAFPTQSIQLQNSSGLSYLEKEKFRL